MRYATLALLAAMGLPAAAQAVTINDSSFETVRVNNYQYNPNTGPWYFYGGTGIAANGSPWYTGSAPDGTQAAFLQSTGYIQEMVTGLTIGTSYSVSYYAAARYSNGNSVDVTFGGFDLGTILPTSPNFTLETTQSFVANATSGMLMFSTSASPDITTVIDEISMNPGLASTAVPEPASLLLLAGGVAGAGLLRRRAAA